MLMMRRAQLDFAFLAAASGFIAKFGELFFLSESH